MNPREEAKLYARLDEVRRALRAVGVRGNVEVCERCEDGSSFICIELNSDDADVLVTELTDLRTRAPLRDSGYAARRK